MPLMCAFSISLFASLEPGQRLPCTVRHMPLQAAMCSCWLHILHDVMQDINKSSRPGYLHVMADNRWALPAMLERGSMLLPAIVETFAGQLFAGCLCR